MAADAPKKPTDAKDEVNSSASAQAADAAGAAAKLEADSKPAQPASTTTDSTSSTATSTSSTDKPAAEAKPGETPGEKPGEKPGENSDRAEEEQSLSERLSALWEDHNSFEEIKGMFGFGKKATAADTKIIPPVQVEGADAKPGSPEVVAKDTAAATAAATPTDAAKDKADPTKRNGWGLLGDIGNAVSWGVKALTPDPIEKACAGVWDATTDWFMESFASIGVDSREEARAVRSDRIYSTGTSDMDKIESVYKDLEGVDKEKAYEDGHAGLDKIKEIAKQRNDFVSGDSGVDEQISKQFNKSPEEVKQIGDMLAGGLSGPLTVDRIDPVKNGKVQMDAAGNQRIENPDGSVSLRLSDGTTIHRNTDGKELWFNKDKTGFLEKQPNGNWESAEGSEYRQVLGKAESLIDLRSKYNYADVLKNGQFVQNLGDVIAAVDEDNARAVRIEKDTGDVILQDKSGEYKVDKSTHQILIRDGDQWVPLPEGTKPPFKIEEITKGRNAGGVKIGNIEINSEFTDIDIDKGLGRWHRLRRDAQGRSTTIAEAPDPDKPGEMSRITTVTDKDSKEAVSTDSDGNKRVIDRETGQVTRTDSTGTVTLRHNFDTGEIWTPDVTRNKDGDITITSSGITFDSDGSIVSASGAVLAESFISGSGLSRIEQAQVEADAAKTSAKVSNIGCMALSIARSGHPNALAVLRHLAISGISMADAAMSQAQGHLPALVTLSLAKSIAVTALGVTNDQSRAVAQCVRMGIFDASTQAEVAIAGSIGSTYVTPESAAIHIGQR